MLPFENFSVDPGDNVLFRIINGGLAFQMILSIEDHRFTVRFFWFFSFVYTLKNISVYGKLFSLK